MSEMHLPGVFHCHLWIEDLLFQNFVMIIGLFSNLYMQPWAQSSKLIYSHRPQ
ncbi:hypothetical protein X975_01776, partial [Stegodyphus mimosarum]